MHSYELGMWKGYHFAIEGIRKIVRKQSYLKLKIEILIANVFQSKMFHQTMFCFSLFRNFTYNSHETYLSDTSGYFVINQQFIEQFHRYHFRALQEQWHLKSKLHLTIIKRLHNVLHQNSNGPLRKHRLSSAGSKWSRLLVVIGWFRSMLLISFGSN